MDSFKMWLFTHGGDKMRTVKPIGNLLSATLCGLWTWATWVLLISVIRHAFIRLMGPLPSYFNLVIYLLAMIFMIFCRIVLIDTDKQACDVYRSKQKAL